MTIRSHFAKRGCLRQPCSSKLLHMLDTLQVQVLSGPDTWLWAMLHWSAWLTVEGCTCCPHQGDASVWGLGAMQPRHAVHRP